MPSAGVPEPQALVRGQRPRRRARHHLHRRPCRRHRRQHRARAVRVEVAVRPAARHCLLPLEAVVVALIPIAGTTRSCCGGRVWAMGVSQHTKSCPSRNVPVYRRCLALGSTIAMVTAIGGSSALWGVRKHKPAPKDLDVNEETGTFCLCVFWGEAYIQTAALAGGSFNTVLPKPSVGMGMKATLTWRNVA
eukprot:SAG11_NODE_325_length_10712_cov_15.479883_8_plen_191_part_00